MMAGRHRWEFVTAEEQVGPYEVSTVMLADGVYETMIFRAPAANATYGAPISQRRAAAWPEAEAEHGEAVAACRQMAEEEA
jgi:hypothetical protein